MPTEHTYRIDFEITQPNLILNGVDGVSPTDYAYIVFSQWYKGDPGVGIPQTISLEDNTLTLSDGGGSVELPIPSVIGDLSDVSVSSPATGETLKYNSTTQKWENAEAGADDYICMLTVTSLGESEQSISCDKSVSEIIAAYNGGKKVYAKLGVGDGEYAINYIFPLTTILEEDGARAVYFANNIFVILNTGIWFFVGVEQNGQDTWSQEEMYSYTMKEKLDNIESYAQVNVQSDWNESDTSDDAYIKNKPTLGTAAALDVAESGNASTSQVVKGDDSRLSDSRNAADVYSWAKAATKPSYSASEVGAIPSTEKGANSGVAELDATGKVPSSQLPSYVDDVLEYASQSAFPATGESGKIYIALDTNKTYRWGGSSYTEISASLALGETSSTAYAGNKGKANADAIAAIKDGTSIDSFADVETALSGKQATIDASHKLSADFISDGSTNKVINVKPDWNAASGADAEILNKPAIHNIPAGGNAGQVLKKTSATDYDVNWANASETLPSAYCTTSGSTAAKKANCSLYVTQANQYLQVLIGSANTHQGALTLNINSAGDKPIYINGTVSSSSNYTLPNGTYFVFYDGTNYYFRTDGKLPMKSADFSGSYTELADKPTIPDAVSGTDDGTNWTSITIGSNTKAIPSGGGGSSTLSGLTDTSITTPANGEVLKYNSTSSKWENSNEIQADYQQMNNTAADYIKNAPLVRIYRSVTGTAAVTTPAESYTGAKYDVTDNTITSYVDGMVVCIKVPVVGNGSYGTGLQINSLGYKPIVYNVNTMITNRYSVGSVIWAVYNDSQGAVFYDAGTKYTVTGCWQVMDYNADTTAPYNLTRYNGTRLVSANLYRYVLLLRKDLTTLIPIHSVVGTSPAATTATTKTMTTESFDPFGEIYYYPTSEEVTAGNAVAMSALYTQKSAVDGRYIFNSGKTLTANKEIYLVMDLQSDGKVKLASTAWSQTLPSTNDGHLYKLLGYTYDSYRFELYNYHPIYYYDGTQLRQYTGAAIPDAVSGTNDGTNWTTLTIGSVTKNIPSGGGGGLTNYDFTELSTPTISSGATTITFAANQRNCVELSTNADLAIALVSNNKSDNYIWITNSHSTDDIDVTFSSISFGATTINDVIGTDSLPTIAHGETLEIGIYVTNSKARITSRIL